MKKDLSQLMQNSRIAAELLKVLAHEIRLLIVCQIGDKEKSVQELTDFLNTSQSNVSQHLAKLRNLGVLETRKDKNQVFYRVKNELVLSIIKTLQSGYC